MRCISQICRTVKLICYNLIFSLFFFFLQTNFQLPKKWKIKMEDDVEVELELEKQLSLAHEMFWRLKTKILSQQPSSELLLNNNFFRQRKLSNFEEDEFPKKQSNLCFSSSKILPCGGTTSNNDYQDEFPSSSKETLFKEIFPNKYHERKPSPFVLALLKINKVIHTWIGLENYCP